MFEYLVSKILMRYLATQFLLYSNILWTIIGSDPSVLVHHRMQQLDKIFLHWKRCVAVLLLITLV